MSEPIKLQGDVTLIKSATVVNSTDRPVILSFPPGQRAGGPEDLEEYERISQGQGCGGPNLVFVDETLYGFPGQSVESDGPIQPDDPIFELGKNPLPKSPERTLEDALAHAENCRGLDDPVPLSTDLVLLADEVKRLREEIDRRDDAEMSHSCADHV